MEQRHPLEGTFARALTPALKAELRGWSLLAAGSLAIAGVLALLLALARTPKVQDMLPWEWQSFFYAGLVTHVVFSFVVFYLAALGAFAALATGRAGGGSPRWAALGRIGMWAAVAGAALLLVPTLANSGDPSLNNYVPVLVHPLYYVGLAVLMAGVGLAVVRLLANWRGLGEPAVFGVAVAGFTYLVTLLCFLLAWGLVPADADISNFNERLFWGGGHVLQFTNTALMLAAWHLLAGMAFGAAPLPPALYRAVMAAMAAFVLPAPLFYLMFEVMGLGHREAFTDLLWYGLALPPAVMMAGVVRLLVLRRPWPWRSPAFLGLGLSLLVFGIGAFMGFFLGVGDTRTPSHYHAVIGGVNLSLMGLFLVSVLPAIGRAPKQGWALRGQFHLYGIGQLLHSFGFFAAGAAGVPRKTAGGEQGLDSVWKILSMGVVGLGGAIAVLGGVLFIWVMLRRLLARREGVIDG